MSKRKKLPSYVPLSGYASKIVANWALNCQFVDWHEAAEALGVSDQAMLDIRHREHLSRRMLLTMSAIYHRCEPWSIRT